MGKYLTSSKDKIIYNRIIDVKEANFNEKNIAYKIQNLYILLSFSLITIVLMIAISIYCFLIKCQKKGLLTFHNTNNKLNKFLVDSIH